MNFLFAPWIDPSPAAAAASVGVQPPVALPTVAVPGPTNELPPGVVPSQAADHLAATLALGDPAADQAWFRGHTPRDLAMNGRASAGGRQSLYIRGWVNDMVARRPQDVPDTPFEVIVFPMNVDMEAAFTDESVANDFAVHPGVHSDVYRNAWLRGQEEAQFVRLRHWDGSGAPTPVPSVFDYRTVASAFSVWGWRFGVQRPDVEFLTLRSVSCRSVTLQGTGTVTVVAPASCNLGPHSIVRVDLGPSYPTSEPAGAGAAPLYGRTVTVQLGR
jgi:hypothetical protein